MIFTETPLSGAFVIDLQKREDERGFFARVWCKNEFEARGLNSQLVQANVASSRKEGTLRGLHYQVVPYEEAKLVSCTRGSIFDVIIDLRPSSRQFKEWFGIELTAKNNRMLYVPEGFAHGYQTLDDNTEVFYLVSQFFYPTHERGVRWDDPSFKIAWPKTQTRIVSEKDQSWPDF